MIARKVVTLIPFAGVMGLLVGSTPAIDRHAHPNGLASLEPVKLGGSQQWILIRSQDVSSPILLFIHGGPGTSELTLNRKNTKFIEHAFTVVNWDQRGAGKSFAAGRDSQKMSIDQITADTIELSQELLRRFGQTKLTLVGHSFGSAVGLLAVARRPDLFAAYVGIGQIARSSDGERLSWEWTRSRAEQAGDRRSVRTLDAIGPPPYVGPRWQSHFMTQRRLLGKFGGEYHQSTSGALGPVLRSLLASREYSIIDRINFFRGIFRSVRLIMPQVFALDLFRLVPEVQVPVFFCLGRHDHEVPSSLAAEYFDALVAPAKWIVWFERSAHLPNTEQRDEFNAFLTTSVHPLARA